MTLSPPHVAIPRALQQPLQRVRGCVLPALACNSYRCRAVSRENTGKASFQQHGNTLSVSHISSYLVLNHLNLTGEWAPDNVIPNLNLREYNACEVIINETNV